VHSKSKPGFRSSTCRASKVFEMHVCMPVQSSLIQHHNNLWVYMVVRCRQRERKATESLYVHDLSAMGSELRGWIMGTRVGLCWPRSPSPALATLIRPILEHTNGRERDVPGPTDSAKCHKAVNGSFSRISHADTHTFPCPI